MNATLSNQEQAQLTAATRAAAALAQIDLPTRCALLHLPAPAPDGNLTLRMLAQEITIAPPTFDAYATSRSTPAGPSPIETRKSKIETPTLRLLALHYLLHDAPIHLTGEMISFRDLPGGNFYFGPFSNRTTRPLAQRIANDLLRLQQNLARFDTTPAAGFPSADLAVRIHIIGPLHLTLLYHVGDDEAPASAEILFDQAIKRVYHTEDIAVLSSRICFALINAPN